MHSPFSRRDGSAARPGLGFKGVVLAAAAIAAPVIAISAAGALTGNATLGAPVDAVTVAAQSLLGSATPTATAPTTDAAGDTTEQDDASLTATGTTGASPSASASATGSAAAAAHSDGHGCDDVLFADGTKTPTPGGPADCTVGASGDHRQNGKHTATATSSASATASATASASATGDDPHANGHGCDDVMFKDGRHQAQPGGPVGCTVGNSGEHRQNGLHGHGASSPTPTATATETSTPSVTSTMQATGSASVQGSLGGNSVSGHGNFGIGAGNGHGRNR